MLDGQSTPGELLAQFLEHFGTPWPGGSAAIDDFLRAYYASETQAVVAQQAVEIEDLKDQVFEFDKTL